MPKRRSAIEPSEIDIARGKAFAQWLKARCEAMGTNPSQLAKKSGISSSYIYDLANDGVKIVEGVSVYKRPSEEKIMLIASSLGVSPTDGLLAAGYGPDAPPPSPDPLASLPTDIQLKLASLVMDISKFKGMDVVSLTDHDVVTLPVVGYAGAADPDFDVFAEEHRIGSKMVPKSMLKNYEPERCFIIKVRGNCLAGAGIFEGDMVTLVSVDCARDGDIVLVANGDEALLKRFREDGTVRWLETHESNGESNVHRVNDSPDSNTRIIGKAVQVIREL